jgi:nicotinamidase-related amidase
VTKINGLRKYADVVVYTKDWHPEDHCSFASSANARRVSLHRSDMHARADHDCLFSFGHL